MDAKRLLRRFDAWEGRMRGLRPKRYCVPIEPGYRPLLGKERLPHAPLDDARRPGLFERLRSRPPTPSLPRKKQELHLPIAVPAPEEPVELELVPPRDWNGNAAVNRALLESLSRAGHHVGFELVATHERISMRLVCDALDIPIVRSALRSHAPEVQVRESKNTLASIFGAEDSLAAIQHFGLEDRVFKQLRTGTHGDALVEIVGQMDDLCEGEATVLQVLFAPVRYGWHKDLEKFVSSIEDVDHTLPLIRRKFSEPAFAVLVRVVSQARDEKTLVNRARRLMGALVAVTASETNRLTLANFPKRPFETEFGDVFRRETSKPGMLLSLSELETLAHIPSAAVRSPRFLRVRTRTKAAPLHLAQKGLILGVNEHEDVERRVALTVSERLQHCHIIGNTGSGKSSLLLSMATQDIEAGNGFAVLDPHGDLIEDVIARIPANRLKDVVFFDPADEAYPIGFNVLSAHSEIERTLLASDFVSIFRRLSSTTFGDQMVSVLGNAVLAILESTQGGTLLDLRRLLIDRSFRARYLETVQDEEVVRYWTEEFPLVKGLPHASILTRLNTFLRPKILRYMVAQKDSPLDMRRIMDEKKILLAKLSRGLIGEENSHLLGSLLVAKIAQATVSRQDEEAAKREPFALYMDEFHHFVTPSVSDILSGARKYKLSLCLAHHEMRQIKARNEEVASAILSHAYTRIVFQVSDQDARLFADGFSFFEARDLQNLGMGEAVCRVERPAYDFNLRTILPEPVPASIATERRLAVLNASRSVYAQPREDVRLLVQESYGDADTAPKPDAPKKVRDKVREPEPKTPLPGRGGPRHKYLQDLVCRLAEDHGFEARTEETVLDGHGYVDVSLTKGDIRIACEISVSTRAPHELKNIAKGLAAGFTHVAFISDNPRTIEALSSEFEQNERVRFCTPDTFIAFLDELAPQPKKPSVKEKRGYQGQLPFVKPAAGDERNLLGTEAAARYIGVKVGTLAKMRVAGTSPPFHKIGSLVMYDRADLDEWKAKRKRRSTSDPGQT